MNVAPARLLKKAPLAPVMFPRLQIAVPEFTSLPPSSVPPPLKLIPPLAATYGFVRRPPPIVSIPVMVTGLVPPKVPAFAFTTATELAVLKLIRPLFPCRFRVLPETTHPLASVAVPAETVRMDPAVSNVPLEVRDAVLPLRLIVPPPLTSELAVKTCAPPAKSTVVPALVMKVPE